MNGPITYPHIAVPQTTRVRNVVDKDNGIYIFIEGIG